MERSVLESFWPENQLVSVATPAEPRGEKKKLLLWRKFWAVKNF